MQLVERYMYAMLMTSQQYFYMAKTPRRAFHNVVILADFEDLSYCGFTTCQLNALKKGRNQTWFTLCIERHFV